MEILIYIIIGSIVIGIAFVIMRMSGKRKEERRQAAQAAEEEKKRKAIVKNKLDYFAANFPKEHGGLLSCSVESYDPPVVKFAFQNKDYANKFQNVMEIDGIQYVFHGNDVTNVFRSFNPQQIDLMRLP